jgi:hypothetical protein
MDAGDGFVFALRRRVTAAVKDAIGDIKGDVDALCSLAGYDDDDDGDDCDVSELVLAIGR